MDNKDYVDAPHYYVYKCFACLVYTVKSNVLCVYGYLYVCLSVSLSVYYKVSAPEAVDSCQVH